MKRKQVIPYSLMCSVILYCIFNLDAMIPSPNISRGKTVKTSNGADGSNLVNGKFGNSSTWSVSSNSWVAVEIGTGPTKIFFLWNNPNTTWSDVIAAEMSCKKGVQCPQDYTIETSADSEDGSDGQWTAVVTVQDNVVTARGHEVAFEGMRWVRMKISQGGGTLDEIEVFDAEG